MERILLVVAVFAALVTYPCFYIVNNMIVRDILAAPTWEKDGPNQLVEPSVDYFYPDRDQQLLNDGPNAAAAGGVMTTTNSAVGLSHVDLLNNEHNDSKSSADEVPTTRPTVDMVDVYVAAQSEYQHLSLELLHYRSDLTAEERRTFDVHWGLNIDGHFRGDEKKFPTNVSVTVPWCHFNETIPVALRVQADVRYAIQNHFLEASKNKLNGLNDRMKSIRLLYWFQLDLMSKTNAFIVNRKNSREMHCLTLRPVYGITKTLAWTFLWSLNIGMLFFTLWFAVRKDKDLEQAWARSFAAYLVLDMIFTASVSVLIQHVLIPLTASREIDHIKETLIETLMHYNKDNHRGSKRVSDIEQNNAYLNISSFNAAKFIFVSSRLAVEYANLKVAKIISSYRTTSPTLPYNFYTPALVREFASGVCNLPTKTLMYYVSMPSLLQDLIMHIVFTCLMGYMFFYLIQLFDQEQAYIAITILIFGAFALIVYVYCASKQPYDLRHNIIFEEIQDDDVDANNKDQNSYSSRKVAKGSPNLAPLAASGSDSQHNLGVGTTESRDSTAFLSPKFRPKPSKGVAQHDNEDDHPFDEADEHSHGHDGDFDVFKNTIKRYIKKNNQQNKVIDGTYDDNDAIAVEQSKPSMGGAALLPPPSSPLAAAIDANVRVRPGARKGGHPVPHHFFAEDDEDENINVNLDEHEDIDAVAHRDGDGDNHYITIDSEQQQEQRDNNNDNENTKVDDDEYHNNDDDMVRLHFDDDDDATYGDDSVSFAPRTEDDVEVADATIHSQPSYKQQDVHSFVSSVKATSRPSSAAPRPVPQQAPPQHVKQQYQAQVPSASNTPRIDDDEEFHRLMMAHKIPKRNVPSHVEEEEFDVIGARDHDGDRVPEPDFAAFEPRDDDDDASIASHKPPEREQVQEHLPKQRSVVRMPQPSQQKKGTGASSRKK